MTLICSHWHQGRQLSGELDLGRGELQILREVSKEGGLELHPAVPICPLTATTGAKDLVQVSTASGQGVLHGSPEAHSAWLCLRTPRRLRAEFLQSSHQPVALRHLRDGRQGTLIACQAEASPLSTESGS